MAGEPHRSRRPFRRAVFYVAGFDVLGPEYYYRLFKRELAADSALEPRQAVVGALTRTVAGAAPHWRIEANDGADQVEVDYVFLSLHGETVSRYYRRNAFRTLWLFVTTLYDYLRLGAMARFWRSTPISAAVFTASFVGIAAFFVAGVGVAWAALGYLPGGLDDGWRAILAAAAGPAGVQLAILLDRRIWSDFTLCGMRCSADYVLGRDLRSRDRVAGWEREIVACRDAGRHDEVLIVGHSAGAVQAVEFAARLAASGTVPAASRVSLLTLGSIDMIASCFRHTHYRAAVAAAATAPYLVWIEYFSPWDWCCRGATDPVAAADIDLGGRRQTGPEMREIDLRAMFSSAAFRGMPFRLMSRHFDYIRSGDRRSAYSYFRLICRAQPLL